MFVSPQVRSRLQALPNWDPLDSTSQCPIFKYFLSDTEMRVGRSEPAAIGLWLSVSFDANHITLHMMPCYVDNYWNHATGLPEEYYQKMEVIASKWQIEVREILRSEAYDLTYVRVKDHQLFSRDWVKDAAQAAGF